MPALPTTSTTTTTLAGADLAGLGWMSPGAAPSGSKIAVEFSVKNFGTATATGGFYDYIMFSTDYAFGGDTALSVVQHASSVNAGATYTTLVPQVQLPVIGPGTYFLYLQTDGTNAVAETNENNNIGGFVAITIN
jgi:subtilase family serine protease